MLEEKLKNLDLLELESLFASLGDYETTPVGIEEFIDSPRFLGAYFQNSLYPYWREVLKKIYPSPYYSPYFLVSLRGSIGIGKTSCALTGVLYDLYKLICLANPQKTFDLIESTKILFMFYNITQKLAESVVWDQCLQMMISSPFFTSVLVNPQGKKRRKEDTLFPKRIDLVTGSRVTDSLGKALVGGMIDEINFKIINNQMEENFNSFIRRVQSRFTDGSPARLWIVSSETEEQSTMNNIVKQYAQDPSVLVVQESLWSVKSHLYLDFPKEFFWVYTGSEKRSAEIIYDDSSSLLKSEASNCMKVPIRHQSAFQADLEKSLRDIAGISTTSSYKLFKSKEKMTEACSVGNLFPDTFSLNFSEPSDQIMSHCVLPQYFVSKNNDMSKARYIHIDVGVTGDRFGLACTYVKKFISSEYQDPLTGELKVDEVPLTVTEWAFGIKSKPGSKVPIYKVESFIKWLTEQGFYIAGVSADGYQSTQILQNLELYGLQTKLLSVDRTPEPYLDLRNNIYVSSAKIPDNKTLRRELEEVEVSPDGKKIDHPKKSQALEGETDDSGAHVSGQVVGSKDIADAVVGSNLWARENALQDRFSYLEV